MIGFDSPKAVCGRIFMKKLVLAPNIDRTARWPNGCGCFAPC